MQTDNIDRQTDKGRIGTKYLFTKKQTEMIQNV